MLIQSDAAQIPLPDKSIHCVTTSPPYWGLRKYSGVDGCGMFPNLGLEPTPAEFVHNMVIIFREVRRVLRDDGVVWLNLGDSYAGSGGENANTGLQGGDTIKANSDDGTRSGLWRSNPRKTKIQQGNLMLMPHRVAIALQDDGWVIRNDVIWYKRNPMPESQAGWRFERDRKEKNRTKDGGAQMTNLASMDAGISGGRDKVEWEYGEDYELRKGSWRHTRAHEYVFMLTKKMRYWSNQEAVRETGSSSEYDITQRKAGRMNDNHYMLEGPGYGPGETFGTANGTRNPRSVLDVPQYTTEELWKLFVEYMTNPADVLDIPTAPYKGAHYATFPPNLIAPLIRATCPRWACPVCGQGWSPVVEKFSPPEEMYQHNPSAFGGRGAKNPTGGGMGGGQKVQDWLDAHPPQIKEYRPTCDHPHTIEEAVPGIVLDPFLGSGTTVQVAKQLLRRGVGLDISMDYLDEQAKIRTGAGSPTNVLDDLPLFSQMEE